MQTYKRARYCDFDFAVDVAVRGELFVAREDLDPVRDGELERVCEGVGLAERVPVLDSEADLVLEREEVADFVIDGVGVTDLLIVRDEDGMRDGARLGLDDRLAKVVVFGHPATSRAKYVGNTPYGLGSVASVMKINPALRCAASAATPGAPADDTSYTMCQTREGAKRVVFRIHGVGEKFTYAAAESSKPTIISATAA